MVSLNTYQLADSDLSGGRLYKGFEQPGPDVSRKKYTHNEWSARWWLRPFKQEFNSLI